MVPILKDLCGLQVLVIIFFNLLITYEQLVSNILWAFVLFYVVAAYTIKKLENVKLLFWCELKMIFHKHFYQLWFCFLPVQM